MAPKIFLNIASYRDPLLHTTVMSAYNNAAGKDALVFGIVDQSFPGEFFSLHSLPFSEQVRYLRLDPEHGRGACWARNLAQSMWNGEKYYLQVDSHTLFNEGWDYLFLKEMVELEKYHEKPAITAYPHVFTTVGNNINDLKKMDYGGIIALIVDQTKTFDGNWFVQGHARVMPEGPPVHGFLTSAGCLFTHGTICEEVPYDPFLYFIGEEPSLAVRLWTSGYNIFHMANLPVLHHYGRDYRTTVWGDEFIEKHRPRKWYTYDEVSKGRLSGIVTGKLSSAYGLGNKRTLAQYAAWCGIDYENRTLSRDAMSGDELFKRDYKLEVNV